MPTSDRLVLVVEDEPQVMRLLATGLPLQGFRVVEARTGQEALRQAAAWVPDLVLLDLGLPDRDGLHVLADLRAWSQAPVIVLSARGAEGAKVAALDAGADDYVTKPFGFPELLARMRVALRHAARAGPATPAGVFESGALQVDLDARRVRVDGEIVKLTPIEYRLLAVLVRHAGKVVTHRQLLAEVWGPKSADERQYLRVYMTHLRRKLERGRTGPPVFETEAGVGYRLVWDGA
ncbi:MAG: response regulator [Planctomycetes bacterium]|nr:response regulator [Planctomycetota bacterium]